MQIKNIITFALVGFATAAPTDVAQIKKSINSILDALAVLDTSVIGLSEASTNFPELVTKSDAVLNAINQGATDIGASTAVPLSALQDLMSIQTLSNTLYTTGDKVVNDFIAKKAIIAKAGKSGEVTSAMTKQQAATKTFGEALKKKLPSAIGAMVDTTTNKVVTSLENGLKAFRA